MISLAALSGPSDVVATVSLAILALIFGLAPAERIMPLWIRKRQEFALIFAIACGHRGAEVTGAQMVAFDLHIASAVVALASASSAVFFLLRVRHGR